VPASAASSSATAGGSARTSPRFPAEPSEARSGALGRDRRLAAGVGGVWALIGSAGSTEIARFSLTGRMERVWKIPDAGRMAADASGCWISTNHWLLHIDPTGQVHRVIQAQLGDISTGAGAA